jgi:phosphoglycerate kinase
MGPVFQGRTLFYKHIGIKQILNKTVHINERRKYMLNKKSVDDINVKGKRVLVRCDFNVPLQDGKITDENRLVEALPTIKKLINDGGKVILCSHLGKPKGEPKPELSLAPVAVRLQELLGQEVKFAKDDNVVGDNAKAAVAAMKDGEVVLLENTRYRVEETKNVDSFSEELASLCDIFVNDAFGTAHRAHCSNVGITKYVETSVVGYLMQKEIEFLGNAVNNPERPFVAILGGSKVSSKISVINNLLDKVDTLIIGGGMSYTFMKSLGEEVGKSLLEAEYLEYAREMMEKAKTKGVKLLIPIDTVVAKEFSNDSPYKTVNRGEIEPEWEGVDIGEKTRELYAEAIKDAKTVVWNGPMGVFELPNFAKGTIAVAKALAEIEATTIIGGGDSAAAVNTLGFGDKMTHISTGGGASLEFLEGKELPGVAAANDN